MEITIVIRTTAPNINAAQGIYDAILAKLITIPNLKFSGQLNELLVSPLPPETPE